jgi:acyl-CoA synthetase (NDP forming)
MLEPRSIAVLGVSAKDQNFGRIILNNIIECGFDRANLRVIKEGVDKIDGVLCVPRISELPAVTDLLVVAAAAGQLPDLIQQCVDTGKVRSAIVIPGGAGETQDSKDILKNVRETLARGHGAPGGGMVVLGPNCLGVQSRPGRYDTFFIPGDKLDKRRDKPGRGVALISQSGAFIITRLSNIETLDPMLTISFGNQADLTISDMVHAVGERTDIHTIGVYVEGFNDLDGLDMLQAVRNVVERGITVVFYKAGRTAQGRDAAAGHTASVAGDYDICEAGATAAGAVVAGTFKEFEQLLELSAGLYDRNVRGTRLGAISNAGFETVGIADCIKGVRDEAKIPVLPQQTCETISAMLEKNRLAGLVNVRNPLDLTPMANEAAYEAAGAAMLACPEIDALLVSTVPLSPAMATTGKEIAARDSLADVLRRLRDSSDKPVVAVIDSGAAYEPLVHKMRESHIPVFRSADQAVRTLGRYLAYRTRTEPMRIVETKPSAKETPLTV